MQERPAGVPRNARFSLRDGWWQVGELRDGHPFGVWQTWRPDGSRLFDAKFDSKGRLQGAYKRYHPDGSLAREVRYERGLPAGRCVLYRASGATDDIFPATDPRVRQVVIQFGDRGEAQRTLLDEHGREVAVAAPADEPETATGAVATNVAPLDGLFEQATPDGFLASGGLARALAPLPNPPLPPGDDFLLPYPQPPRRALDERRFRNLYGSPAPALLASWLTEFPSAAGGHHVVGVRPIADNDIAASGNLIDALIVEHQAAPGRVAGLRALSSGIVPIAAGDKAVVFCYALGEREFVGSDAIYPLDLAANTLAPPVARSLDDFAYAIALASARTARLVSLPRAQSAYQRLRGRVALPPDIAAVEAELVEDEGDELVGDEKADHRQGFHFRRATQNPRHFFYRCRWLLRLLSGHVEGAAADFDPKYEGGLADERFQRIKGFIKEPHVAFYWLFRCHVFDDPRLAELLAIASDAPAQLTRDAATLVGELAGGRKRLGVIEDWPAVLAELRKLDLLNKPAAAEGDDEGEEEEDDDDDDDDESEDNEEEVDSDDDQDDEQNGDDDELSLAARELAIPDSLAAEAAVLTWALERGYEREGLSISDELTAAAIGLARRGNPSIVPYIAKLHDRASWLGWELLAPWLDGDRFDFRELAEPARRWLADREAGATYRWMSGAHVLARVGTRPDAVAIGAAIDDMIAAVWGEGGGFGAAMTRYDIKKMIWPMIRCVMTLGIPDELEASLVGVVDADSHTLDELRGPCALALASAGRGLSTIVSGIRGQLARGHGRSVTWGQLIALGELGKDADEATRRELRALVESIDSRDEAAIAKQFALHDLGEPGIDVVEVLRVALAAKRAGEERNSFAPQDSYSAAQRLMVLWLIESRIDLPGELAVPYVATDMLDVHLTALRIANARAVAAPELVLYDPYYVAQLAARGSAALHAALADPRGIYRGNIALWISDHPDDSYREPLAANARRLAAERDFPDEGQHHYELRWTVRALIAIGGADSVLDELLHNTNRHVSETVLRYPDQLGAGVARGMVHSYLNREHWQQSTAKSWLAKHVREPAVAAALREHGLDRNDIVRSDEES